MPGWKNILKDNGWLQLVGENTNQRAIHIIGRKWEVEDIQLVGENTNQKVNFL